MIPRLKMGEGRTKSLKQYQRRGIFQVAARMWGDGVPWDEARAIAENAFISEAPTKGKGKPKGKGKGRGKARRS